MSKATRESWNSIIRIIDAQCAAWDDGDALKLASFVMPDILLTGFDGKFSAGVKAFIKEHQRIFSTDCKGSRLAQNFEHFKFLSAEIAIVHTLALISGVRHKNAGLAGTVDVFRTRVLQVMVLCEGVWTVQAFHVAPTFLTVFDQNP